MTHPPRATVLDQTMEGLRSRIDDRTARIAVIGCGYVGLPLLVGFADAGFEVTGIEHDRSRVEQLQRGESYILDVPSAALAQHVRSGRLDATTEYDAVRDNDVIFVSVPTPFDRLKLPDLSFVITAAEGIAERIRPGHLIILESTTFPGTTDEILRPILERGGLRAGVDFGLAFSPERIDPGNKTFRITNTPKVVGGVDALSGELARHVLAQLITEGQVHLVSSARAAELTKLLENTYRAVNIALVNELAMLCSRMGIDIWEVIDAAATKPYGFTPFYPGPGVGGHCIPVDPYYLAWKAREFDFRTKFIELAAETNLEMPFFTVDRVRGFLSAHGIGLHGARILVLGASFKRDIDDARNSAAVRVMEILCAEGVALQYHDPFVPEVALVPSLFAGDRSKVVPMRSVGLTPEALASTDCVLILVAHSAIDQRLVLEHAPRVFDAVNATKGASGRAILERL